MRCRESSSLVSRKRAAFHITTTPYSYFMQPIEKQTTKSSELSIWFTKMELAWSYIPPAGANLGVDGVLEALEGVTQPIELNP